MHVLTTLCHGLCDVLVGLDGRVSMLPEHGFVRRTLLCAGDGAPLASALASSDNILCKPSTPVVLSDGHPLKAAVDSLSCTVMLRCQVHRCKSLAVPLLEHMPCLSNITERLHNDISTFSIVMYMYLTGGIGRTRGSASIQSSKIIEVTSHDHDRF